MNDSSKRFSRRERQIMDALYEGGELSAQQVRAAIADAPSYSSVRALIAKLVEKGDVTFRQDGPRYIYSAVESRDEVQSSALQRLVKTFFAGSRIQAVNALLGMDSESLSDSEVEALQKAIAAARESNQK